MSWLGLARARVRARARARARALTRARARARTQALLRLFAELKLDPAERVSYGLVATHPLGQALLDQCSSYTPKGVYALVAELQAQAGSALKM